MSDTASDAGHESLADSSYDIVSEADSAFDDVSSSSVPSRVDTPTYDTDEEDENRIEEGESREEAPETKSELDAKLEQPPTGSAMGSKSDSIDEPIETPRASAKFDKPASSGPAPTYAVADTLVDVSRPFRIAYHGPNKYKDAVVEKIGQALSISNNGTQSKDQGSMYSIVQLSSFGNEQSSPDVTLIPSTDTQMLVQTCEFCACNKEMTEGREDMQSLKEWQLEEGRHNNPERPLDTDLTVFMHEVETDRNPHGYRQSARFSASAQQNGIHVLDIANEQQHSFFAKFQAGHLRLNMRGIARLYAHPDCPWMPIDLRSFLDLDARELNLSLAHMMHERTRPIASHASDAISSVKEQVSSYYSSAVELYDRTISDPQTVSKALLVSFLLLVSLLAGNFISGFLRPVPIDSDIFQDSGSLRSIEAQSTAQSNSKTPLGSEHTKSSDWLPLWDQRQASKAVQTMIAGVPEKEVTATDPTVELVPVKDLLYYLKMLPEAGPRTQSIQPKVTASSAGQPVRVSTARWNGTLFSLDFQPEDKSQVIDVFVGFEKSPRVYVFKIGPHSSWLDLARMQKLIDRQLLESGVAACLATTKELSQVGQRQLAVFRDHASELAVGSKEWLQYQAKAMRNTSSVTAVTVWERFNSRQAVVTASLGRTSQTVSKEVQAYTQHFTQALSQNVVSLKAAKEQFTHRVQKNAIQARQDVSTRVSKMREQVKSKHGQTSEGVFKKARTRASALRSKLKTKRQARSDSRSARRAARKSKKLGCNRRGWKCKS